MGQPNVSWSHKKIIDHVTKNLTTIVWSLFVSEMSNILWWFSGDVWTLRTEPLCTSQQGSSISHQDRANKGYSKNGAALRVGLFFGFSFWPKQDKKQSRAVVSTVKRSQEKAFSLCFLLRSHWLCRVVQNVITESGVATVWNSPVPAWYISKGSTDQVDTIPKMIDHLESHTKISNFNAVEILLIAPAKCPHNSILGTLLSLIQ